MHVTSPILKNAYRVWMSPKFSFAILNLYSIVNVVTKRYLDLEIRGETSKNLLIIIFYIGQFIPHEFLSVLSETQYLAFYISFDLADTQIGDELPEILDDDNVELLVTLHGITHGDLNPTFANSLGILANRFRDEPISCERRFILDAAKMFEKKLRRSASLNKSGETCLRLVDMMAIATVEGF